MWDRNYCPIHFVKLPKKEDFVLVESEIMLVGTTGLGEAFPL